MIFAFFAQVVATCYVQATWIDVSRSFYFERMVGVVFWAVLLALFSYALLRGIADSLTGKMADPSLYGARVREAWRAWRELPRYRIVQRADLMAQVLYLALTVLCIFYLVVISIDWYDGVIRIGDWFRQIAIDGRYRDFPIWSFVIPSIVLMAWKTITILRTEPASRSAPHLPRRSRSAACWATTAAAASCAWTGRSAASGRSCRRSFWPGLLIFWAVVMLVTEGAIKLHDGGAGGFVSADGGRWVIRTLFWNTQANWFAVRRRADGGALSGDDLRIDTRTTGRTAAGLLYQQVVGVQPGVTTWKSRANTGSPRRARRFSRRSTT